MYGIDMQYIKNNEGLRLKKYYINGIPHIGYGHNILVKKTKKTITRHAAEMLFIEDVSIAKQGAMNIFKSYKRQPHTIQTLLVDMTYNMGRRGMSRWGDFIDAIDNKNYLLASCIIMKSDWRKQVGDRSYRAINILKIEGMKQVLLVE